MLFCEKRREKEKGGGRGVRNVFEEAVRCCVFGPKLEEERKRKREKEKERCI